MLQWHLMQCKVGSHLGTGAELWHRAKLASPALAAELLAKWETLLGARTPMGSMAGFLSLSRLNLQAATGITQHQVVLLPLR